jgi:cytochrome c biogenesis protein CcdA
MKSPLARFRQAGSFVAGFLIGLSIVVPVLAMMVASPGDWQTFLVFGAPIILALGITLQVVITAKPRHRRTIDTKLRAARDREAWPMLQQSLTPEVLYR